MWAGGIAAAAALVARWGIVGVGYSRLAGGVLVLAAGSAAAAGAGGAAWLATAAALAAAVFAGSRAVGALFTVSSALLIVAAAADSPVLAVLSGSVFLGAITAEMMLGHWYLVDPTLPRWALQALVAAAGVGLVADAAYLIAEGALSWGTGDEVLGWAFVVLSLLTMLLAVGVSLALREPAYSGVMAATGLSYLAVLTSFGVVVVGRLLAF